MPSSPKVKRALILAGGGLKVCFQAGVLQVWMDEAGLTFDHADGASGGCFNLAMYCQGMTGKQIADNWRNLDPFLPVDLNWQHYWKLAYTPSLFTYDNFRKKVLPAWGIDWDVIRKSDRLGTFNIFNFSRKELAIKTNDQMDEDFLIASVSLPMFFPPVVIDGETYLDSVYISDANVEEAIRRGADEIWAIWTVSTKDEWRDGFIAQYFQIIETVADTNFFSIWNRIEESNRAIQGGGTGEFGRHIKLKLLQAEVPVHYLFNFSQDRMEEAVNQGVMTAREWCREQKTPLQPGAEHSVDIHKAVTSLQFTEEMKGYVAPGEKNYGEGFQRGKAAENHLMFHLTIKVDGVNRFVTRPQHEAVAEGWIQMEALGGKLPVEKGVFNLFLHEDDPEHKQMLYRLFFRDRDGAPFTLSGYKDIRDDPGFDAWEDTTTLFTRIYEGHVTAEEEKGTEVYAAGILRIYVRDFLKQLTTFEVEGPSLHDRTAALLRFARLFLGKLWDVYGHYFMAYAPL